MKILIIRLSAMGDVALTVPVIQLLSDQHPDNEIYLLTKKPFNPFFKGIESITLVNPDLNGKHKGIFGLFKLYKKIKKEFYPDIVIDLHDVLRSKILRFLFKLNKTKSFKIEKARKEKKKLTQKNNKTLVQLKHTTQRYVDTFIKAGIHIELKHSSQADKFEIDSNIKDFIHSSSKKIGIAPFAMHKQKQYPINKMQEVIKILDKKGYQIYIFGGGNREQEIGEKIAIDSKTIHSVIGKFSLEDEISLISKLDLMISMDSANMHIAALTGIKILSIWGATHSYAGFSPFIQEVNSYIIQNEGLDCRPCSVYGNKECYKGTLECMNSIQPETIAEQCEIALNQ